MTRSKLSMVLALALSAGAAHDARSQTTAPADAWITTKVEIALLTTPDVSVTRVDVDTVDGKVTLHGMVGSADERARAETAARAVRGVKEVRDLLQVVETQRQDAMKVSDEKIAEEITRRIDADPALAEDAIDVQSVNDGVVLLSGSAKTLADHLRAIEVAHGVSGVKRVASEIRSPDDLGDEAVWHDDGREHAAAASTSARDLWITTETKLRLIGNADTPARDIHVDTSGGVVTLFGAVPDARSRALAEAAAKKVEGVKRVENHLQVVPPASSESVQASDARVKSEIETRIQSRDLKGADIDVEVARGVARLTGTVQSQTDRLTALTVARSTHGVRSVLGDLDVVEN